MNAITAKNINKGALITGTVPNSPLQVNRNKFYQYSTPDYFRVEREPSQKKATETVHFNTEGSPMKPPPVTIISKTTGWLTVEADTLDRKHAFEKDKKVNIRQTSKLAPPWMINSHTPDVNRLKMFKAMPVIGHNVNMEKNRVYLQEPNQIPKSIFNINQVRHDVHNPEDVGIINGKPPIGRPSRLIEWNEKIEVQPYDQKKIATKIGQTDQADGGRMIDLRKIRKNL